MKILFFDIDGTLIDFDGHMPDSTREALRTVREKGNKVLICTGRSCYQVPPELPELADGIVASTGAFVKIGDEILHETFLPYEQAERICAVIDSAGGFACCQAEEQMILTQSSCDRGVARFRRLGKPESSVQRIFGNARIAERKEDYAPVKKIVYFDSELPVKEIAARLPDFDVTPASFGREVTDSGEVTCRGINKSYGMQKVLEHYGLGREASVAFGDGANDIDMIEFAGTGIAMGNACEALKSRADRVTADIGENGIYRALAELGMLD